MPGDNLIVHHGAVSVVPKPPWNDGKREGGRNQPSISSPIIYKIRTSEQINVLSILHLQDEMLSIPFKNVKLDPLLVLVF